MPTKLVGEAVATSAAHSLSAVRRDSTDETPITKNRFANSGSPLVPGVVCLEPLPAEHTARSGLQLRPPARWAAAHAVDRTERELDDPVPRIEQRQDGRPCVGVKYAAVKSFQLVLERFERTLQRRGVVLKSDILHHTASCIAQLEPTCEVLGALPVGGEDVRSELHRDEGPLIQFEGGDFRRRADGQLRPEPSTDGRWRTACTKSSMIAMRIILLAVSIACVVVVVSPRGRRVVARKFTDARPFVSRRAVDPESFASSRAVDTWENEGGAIPGASDRAR